jgi:arginyl-tRNA synthetase
MIKKAIVDSIKQIIEEEKIEFSSISIEPSSFGDYSTSFPLKLRKFKEYQTAPEIARFFVSKLTKNPLFSEVTFSEPGFINFVINQKEAANYLREVIGERDKFGKNQNFKGKKARVEFVSANPTGPLHIGNARGGPLGDSISNVLAASGYEVMKEYINNNRGNQIKELGTTVAVRAGFIQEDEPLTYTGDYIGDLA